MRQQIELYLDKLNQYEIILIRFFQKIFLAEKYVKFHQLFEYLVSPQNFSFIPLLFYSIGKYNESFLFAKCCVLYIFITHKFKKFVFRKRPYAYSNIFNPDHVRSSSFPSNHTAGSVILASFFPTRILFLKIFFVFLMQLNRIILGCHFPTDTIIGALIGLLILFISKLVNNQIVMIIMLFCICFDDPYFSWLFGSSLAFFIHKRNNEIKTKWLRLPLSFIVFPLLKHIKIIFKSQIEKRKSFSFFTIHFLCYYFMILLFKFDIENDK